MGDTGLWWSPCCISIGPDFVFVDESWMKFEMSILFLPFFWSTILIIIHCTQFPTEPNPCILVWTTCHKLCLGITITRYLFQNEIIKPQSFDVDHPIGSIQGKRVENIIPRWVLCNHMPHVVITPPKNIQTWLQTAMDIWNDKKKMNTSSSHWHYHAKATLKHQVAQGYRCDPFIRYINFWIFPLKFFCHKMLSLCELHVL